MTKNDFVGVEFCDENPIGNYGGVQIPELSEICRELEKRGKRYAVVTEKYPKFQDVLTKVPVRTYKGRQFKAFSQVILPDGFKVRGKRSNNTIVALVLYKEE